MSEKVRIGLVGLGFMGTTHFRIHQSLPDAQVVAVADIDPVRRQGDVSTVSGNIGDADNSVPLDLTGIKSYADGLEMNAMRSLTGRYLRADTWQKELIVAAMRPAGMFSRRNSLP